MSDVPTSPPFSNKSTFEDSQPLPSIVGRDIYALAYVSLMDRHYCGVCPIREEFSVET